MRPCTGSTDARRGGSRSLRQLAAALLASLVLGCGGAYGEAVARGDQFAEAGLWDKAAAEYEAATRLDAADPEAQIKLKDVRRRQSAERLARGKALLARGELAPALTATQEAVRLDPDSVEAQKALADANQAVLAKAEELLTADDGKKAFELTTLVLAGSPHEPRARRVDGAARDRLAEQSYARADAFAKRDKRGNALMELAACVGYRPGYRDAKLRIGELKLALTDELTFFVVLDRFTDRTAPKDIAATLGPELVGRAFDEKLPVRVVREAPATATRGVHVWGAFAGYAFAHDKNKVSRTCDYVCGTDTKPNPDYASTERAVADAERRLAQAEEGVTRQQREVDRHQKDVDAVQKDVDRAEQDADKARADLDKCRASAPPANSSACSSEQSRMSGSQSSLDSARRRLDSPKSSLASARDGLSRENDRRETARRDKERDTERMRTTPRTIEVERRCAHSYGVDVHDLTASVTVELSAEGLGDKAKLLDREPFKYEVRERDETFEAQRGRCAEVASGDPLVLPTEKDVKQQLVTQAIAGVREKAMASYDRYRQRFLADARREEAEGLADEAVEAYVRYLLTGPKSVDPRDAKQITEFLSRTRGFGKIETLGGL